MDFVYDDSRTVNPTEVKYQKQPPTADINELKEFINLYGLNKGIVVTRDTFKIEELEGCWILFIPLWLFLLII